MYAQETKEEGEVPAKEAVEEKEAIPNENQDTETDTLPSTTEEKAKTTVNDETDTTEATETLSDDDVERVDYSTPQTYEIGGITITGTKYLDEKILARLSGLEVGEEISIPGEQIPDAISTLWKQGLFSDVKIYASKIVNSIIFLEVALKERVRLSKYTFKGVKKSEEDDLRDQLELVRGRIINENLLNNTKNSILSYYRGKGFYNASVNMSQDRDPMFKNSDILTLNITRGDKIRVNEITFKGNNNALNRKLKKQMSGTKEKSKIHRKAGKNIWKGLKKASFAETLGNLTFGKALDFIDNNIIRLKIFSSSKYLEDEYEADKQSVIAYYNELGFRDARIVTDTMYFVDSKSVNLEVTVDEGQRYYFRDIEWKGNSKYTNEQLGQILGIEKGDVYDKSLLQRRLFMDPAGGDVSSLYMDDGYLFFNVSPMEKAVVGDSIDLLVNVYEGPQATIDKINISGNTKTNEHVIRRELRSLPGSKFSRSDIIRSQREIATLGFFDPEQIEINPRPNPEKGTVDIDYKVAEKPSDQLELSAGWGGRTVVGSIGVSFNNFSLRNIFKSEAWRPLPSGDGQRLSFRFQSTGQAFQSINASFTEPWLGGKRPNALSVSAYSSRYRSFAGFTSQVGEDPEELGRLLITGLSVGLGRRLRFPDDNFTLQTALTFQHYSLKDWSSDFIISNGSINNLSLTNTLSRYSINQPIYPSSGSNISLSLQLTPPYSMFGNKDYRDVNINERYKWAEFHKWKLKAEWYTKIVGNLVLKTSAKMGFMGYYNEDIGHSPLERFQIGGDGISNFDLLYGKDIISLRGYDVLNTASVGNPYYAKYNVELRYPLSLNPNSTIYVLGFVEGGNSWESFKTYNPFELRRSAGLGLRIFLPMFGTLGFDYGVGFDKGIGVQTDGVWDYISQFGKINIVLGVEPE